MNIKIITIFLYIAIILLFNKQLHAQEADTTLHKTPKLGLVLSGGGAKGFAHIGVIKVLEENRIRPDYITGTSMGALVAGLYSMGYSASELEDIVVNADWDDLLSDKISLRNIPFFEKDEYPGYPIKTSIDKGMKFGLPSGMIKGQKIQARLANLVWDSNFHSDFDSFPIPYRCVAADIISGKAYIFKNGNLAEAMRASMAIPTVFTPIDKDKMLLIDGGAIRNFPVQECIDMGADIIIGVYTGFNNTPKKEDLKSMTSILARSGSFHAGIVVEEEKYKTDVFIEPDLKKFSMVDFKKNKEIIDAGKTAALDSSIIEKIKNIASIVNSGNDTISTPLDIKKIWIDKIEVEGNKHHPSETIIEIGELERENYVTADILDNAIKKIYSTWQFAKVTYFFKKNESDNTLVIKVEEKSRASLEIGLQYDNSYGTGVLLNARIKNVLLKSTKVGLKLLLSENPRALLSYKLYPTKRKRIELALNAYSQVTKMPEIFREGNAQFTIGHYMNTLVDSKFTVSWSPFRNTKLYGSIGTQFNNISLREGLELFYEVNTFKTYRNYFNYGLLINTLNYSYFPTKGIYFNLNYRKDLDINVRKYDISILTNNFSKSNEILNIDYKQYILIAKRFSIIPELSLGAMSQKPLFFDRFFIGGYNYSLRPNVVNFGGTHTNYIAADLFGILGIGFQLKFKDHWYFQSGMQIMYIINVGDFLVEEGYDSISFEDKVFTNWNCGIGYKSKFGPLRLNLSKIKESKKFIWSVNIGVPF